MTQLAAHLKRAVELLDRTFAGGTPGLDEETKLYNAVVLAARAFQDFLTIHPYVNGNGHVARFLVWLLLGRYDYWPVKWTIDPRPNATEYAKAIAAHRRGHALPLEKLILESLTT